MNLERRGLRGYNPEPASIEAPTNTVFLLFGKANVPNKRTQAKPKEPTKINQPKRDNPYQLTPTNQTEPTKPIQTNQPKPIYPTQTNRTKRTNADWPP